MTAKTIGILSPGDMGHKVGEYAISLGHRAVTALDGRSDVTRMRAERAGFEDLGSLAGVAAAADIILSIMPPERAAAFADEAIAAIKATGAEPLYVDCNAISPATTQGINDAFEAAGLPFANVGIIGSPPGGLAATKFYASGELAGALDILDGDGISVRQMGPEITRASAIKMCYAGLTKGLMTLQTSVLLAAEMLGVYDELTAEFAASQKPHWDAMQKRGPFQAANAGRWSGEMDEIAKTFNEASITGKIHDGAAEVFRFLDATALGQETPETLDRDRTIGDTVKIYRHALESKRVAE
ncbi:MAG: NAD(P)-dependent oxidoreductase [Rhodospirillales bacterium]|nr:NAD(P)-dependent oxidoreductase [Rhodospirillales bacterium]